MNRTSRSDKDYWMPGESLLHRDESHFHPVSMVHRSPHGSEGTSSSLSQIQLQMKLSMPYRDFSLVLTASFLLI